MAILSGIKGRIVRNGDTLKKEIKKDILEVLTKSLSAIKRNDITELRELSNHTLHTISVYQDDYSAGIAVLIYSLSKIFERSDLKRFKDWDNFYESCLTNLKNAKESLEKDDVEFYVKSIKSLLGAVRRLETNLGKYIADVFSSAKIHKASRIHEHGISVGRTAELLGVSEWDIMEYIGKTGISDVPFSISKKVNQRIKFTRSLFK